MKKKAVILILASFISTVSFFSQANAATNQIIFNEIKVDSATNEYVSIFNQSDAPINLANWQLEYLKPGLMPGGTDCRVGMWNVAPANLSGVIGVAEIKKIPMGSMNDDKGGSVRLSQIVGGSKVVHDVVGWGDIANPSLCYEASQAPMEKNGHTLVRCTIDGIPSDSDNNQADFLVIPVGSIASSCPDNSPPPSSQCADVIVSEIVSTTGVSTGPNGETEFIELRNVGSEAIDLAQCKLSINGSSRSLSGIIDLDKEYFTLWFKNGTIRDSSGQVIFETLDSKMIINYPAMKANNAYILVSDINNEWAVTLEPTPGMRNVLVEGGVGKRGDSSAILKSCRSDQFRNPATNRCKLISSATSTLKPCAPNQYRNPETNRCRLLSAVSSVLKPCNADQFRNPETNRCKKISSATSALKPCKPNQQRNLETNRCRKVVSNSEIAGAVDEIPQENGGSENMAWWLVGLAGGSVVLYGIYEWRTEIIGATLRLRDVFTKGGPPGE